MAGARPSFFPLPVLGIFASEFMQEILAIRASCTCIQ